MSDKICRICNKHIEGTVAITCHFPYRDPPFTEYDCFECCPKPEGSKQYILANGDYKFNLIKPSPKEIE